MSPSLFTHAARVVKTRDVASLARDRHRRGGSVAHKLIAAGVACGSKKARGVGECIERCTACRNIWVADDLNRQDDAELYKGTGALWNCAQKLCPVCVAMFARRNRRRVRRAMGIDRKSGEWWRLVTLTMPTIPAEVLPLLENLKLLLYALELFRERVWWSKRVRAAIKNLEFTLGDLKRLVEEGREWEAALDGFHTHAHLLVLSMFLEVRRLRAEWSESLITALEKFGVADLVLTPDGRFNTPSGHAVVDVRLVVNRKVKGQKGLISFEGAIQEATKYVTKSNSWESIPDAQLVEVAEVKRWPRMFELLGDARESRQSAEQKRAAAKSVADRSGAREPEGSASVHTHLITPALPQRKRRSPPGREGERGRAPTLRELLEVLPFDEWLRVLDFRVLRTQRYRRVMLARCFPFATFTILDGVRFGAEVETERFSVAA